MSRSMSGAGSGKTWEWLAILIALGGVLPYLYFLSFERAKLFSGEGLEEFIFYQYMWPWTETAAGRFIMVWLVLPVAFLQTFFILCTRWSFLDIPFRREFHGFTDGCKEWYFRLFVIWLIHSSFAGFLMIPILCFLNWMRKNVRRGLM